MSKKAAPEKRFNINSFTGGLVGVLLAYAFISRAFSTGSYWQYTAFLVFLILGIKMFVRTFKTDDRSK